MLPCDIRRGKREIGRRGQPQSFGNVGNVLAPASRKDAACSLNRIVSNLRNQPIQNPLVTFRNHEDASGLLPSSVGR